MSSCLACTLSLHSKQVSNETVAVRLGVLTKTFHNTVLFWVAGLTSQFSQRSWVPDVGKIEVVLGSKGATSPESTVMRGPWSMSRSWSIFTMTFCLEYIPVVWVIRNETLLRHLPTSARHWSTFMLVLIKSRWSSSSLDSSSWMSFKVVSSL